MKHQKPKKIWFDLAEGNLRFVLAGLLVLAVAFSLIQAASAPVYSFDFGTVAIDTTQSGYLRVTGANVYDIGIGYGWKQMSVVEVDHPEVSNLLERDANLSSSAKEFMVDLDNGFYRLDFTSGDLLAKRTTIVRAEGKYSATMTSATNQWLRRSLEIEVTDGQLNIALSSVTGTSWAVNALAITPIDAPSQSVTLVINPQNVNLKVGDKVTLIANQSGATWSSGNTGVATVNNQGLVTAVSPGQAIITAALAGQTATSSITVSASGVTQVPDNQASDSSNTPAGEDIVSDTLVDTEPDDVMATDEPKGQTFLARVVESLFTTAVENGTIQTAGDYPFDAAYEENQPNNFWGSVFGFVGVAN